MAPHAERLLPGTRRSPRSSSGASCAAFRASSSAGRHGSRPRRRARPRGLSYLHANCSNCHDSKGPLSSLGASLRHSLGARTERDEPAAAVVGRPTRYRVPGVPDGSVWIRPGAPSSSAIVERMASRSALAQMPPLGTKVVDVAAVARLGRWIPEALQPPEHARQ
jgi:hypothetical protein